MIAALIVIAVATSLVAVYWCQRALHAEAHAAQLGAELDEAYQATAALSVDRGSAVKWRKRAEAALRGIAIVGRRSASAVSAQRSDMP